MYLKLGVPPGRYWDCISRTGACQFNDIDRHPIAIDENGTRAAGVVETSSHPTQWVMVMPTQEYRQTGTHEVKVRVVFNFDEMASFEIPSASGQVIISVATFTGRSYDITPGADPEGLLQLNSTGPGSQDNTRYLIQVKRPADAG
jgi:hypothetical protein